MKNNNTNTLNATIMDLKAFGEKITEKLRKTKKVPAGQLRLGAWLWWNFSPWELALLDELELAVGAESANTWLVERMIASGRYRDCGDGELQAIL